MSFWTSPIGQQITGSERDSFVPDLTVIPEGTMATGVIKSCTVENKEATQYGQATKFIQVVYKLSSGDFKNREVTQKIKAFDGKPEAIHRSLNMLKLLMTLCNYKPSHDGEPTNQDLMSLHNKVIGLKIGEWSMPRADGTVAEGNFVRECHPAAGFKSETGVSVVVTHKAQPAQGTLDSAFSRNAKTPEVDDLSDIPF